MEAIIFIVLISALVFGFVAKSMAANKKISSNSAFWFGFFLGPIGLIIVALARDNIPNHMNIPSEKTFIINEYSGSLDIKLPAYRLFLTENYNIRHNNVVETYSVDADNVFLNLEDAILYCDKMYKSASSQSESFSNFVNSNPLSDAQIKAITKNIQGRKNGFWKI